MEYITETFLPYARILTPLLIEGLQITLYVSAAAFVLSTVLGAVLAVIQHFKVKGLAWLVRLYISYFRGTPLLIQLFLFYYGLPMVFDVMKQCPKVLALIICLALNSAAYISEAIRGAIDSVDQGQYEASLAFGMTRYQMMTRIVLPQAAVAAIPPITNSCMDIIKMSSLGMTIGIQDIMGEAQLTAATYYKTFETYIIAAAFYWVLAIVLGKIQKKIEKKVSAAYQK
ncbi:amino acid ABC transporter permease [Faecalicatena contorta]|uniref:amino acid ABC transporter permease n=1 Tax=Lachnospiraceae TaxID=186803 RepID=UPI00196173BA|nr:MULTISPECIES: amino acid ABC transporter permease [Lachnospiraceae]MBM6685086.1 amino acid ABC transporter permease [Faecalicatena contorta]MBM6710614.1 amino acid ABC transporter permease [Faecalicatena contorta]